VKKKQDTFGNGKTNGRPKKKSTISQAERRITDIVSFHMNLDGTSYHFFCSH
jgi:hypothetical protein